MDALDENEGVVNVSILMDRITFRRLVRFAEAVRGDPAKVAGELLGDLLEDDEEAHRLPPPIRFS